MEYPDRTTPFQTAVDEWRSVHKSWLAPELSDISPEISASATIGRHFDRTGLIIDPSSLTNADLSILIDASGCLSDMSGWLRADVTHRIVTMFGCTGVIDLASKHPQAYREFTSKANKSRGTLQNDYTTAEKWPKRTRRPSLSYSHHQALNPLNPAERLIWADHAESGEWSVSLTRMKVEAHQHPQTAEDEDRWETTQKAIDNLSSQYNLPIERTSSRLSIGQGIHRITFKAVILPTGRAAIELQE